jgi:hypothetical protein
MQGVAVGVIVVATICQLAAPYWDWRVSLLDFFCCFSITFNCVAVVYYNNAAFADSTEFDQGAERLDAILVAVNAFNIALITGVFVLTCIETKFRGTSVRKLSETIAHLAVRVQRGIIENRDGFFKALNMGTAIDDADEIEFEDFAKAAAVCHADSSSAPSREALHALFYILKLVQGDENHRSMFLSLAMRKTLAAANTGVRKSLVSAWGFRWAHSSHICYGTGRTPHNPTSGLGPAEAGAAYPNLGCWPASWLCSDCWLACSSGRPSAVASPRCCTDSPTPSRPASSPRCLRSVTARRRSLTSPSMSLCCVLT